MKKIINLLLTGLLVINCTPMFGDSRTSSSADFCFDISQTPFSCYGSYMSLVARYDKEKKTDVLDLNDMTGRELWDDNHILSIEPMNGTKQMPVHYKGTPIELTGDMKKGNMSIYFESPRILHLYLKDADLCLSGNWDNSTFNNLSFEYSNTYIIGKKNIALTIRKGKVEYKNNKFQLVRDEQGTLDIVLEQYYDNWTPHHYFESREVSLERLRKEYEVWEQKIPSVTEKYQKGRHLASYLNWSCIYEPREKITRYGMAMSKKKMIYIWSWDHCFNAMSLIPNSA